MPGIEVIPSAKRLIKSLRDMGYDFSQAIADVVDNSIEAKATVVAIDIEFDGDDSRVRITDNGVGMRPDQLREAMRYGAERDYGADDLGKFGLGLKTASMSQCQCLSVASRWNRDRADIAAYSLDLEHIERTNKWEILSLDRDGQGPAIREPLKDTTGTVVLWQRLDRILGYKHPYGELARKQLSRMCRDVESHLAMVFHRFLSGEVRSRRLKLLLNGNEIRAWDPFCRTETKTKSLQTIRIPLEHEGVSGVILFEPFILPHKDDFSSPDAFNQASGPANWNQQQGLYIYRAGRMIQSGGWSNLRTPDEHTKLARMAVSFSPRLDEAFKINVAKMRVQVPAQIREEVKNAIVAPLVRLAREVYDRKQVKASATSTPGSLLVPAPQAAPKPPSGVSVVPALAQSGSAPSSILLTLDEWARRTLGAATEEERPIVEVVLERVQNNAQRQ